MAGLAIQGALIAAFVQLWGRLLGACAVCSADTCLGRYGGFCDLCSSVRSPSVRFTPRGRFGSDGMAGREL